MHIFQSKALPRTIHSLVILTALSGCIAESESPVRRVGITRIAITERVNFSSKTVGSAGPYELVNGIAYGKLDPKASENAGIVNLNHAPQDANGLVDYSVDVTILKPADISKGNGILLNIVTNRGDRRGLVEFNNEIGLEFLITHGYTIFWNGWEGSLPPNPTLAKAYFPTASHDGKAIEGPSREEFTDVPSGHEFTLRLTYPAATLNPSAASLTVREGESDLRKPLAASSWTYVDASHLKISSQRGFDRGAVYEFIYRATNPVVMGVGFAATRDLASFLRYADEDSTGAPNPVRSASVAFKAALARGGSQGGRFLRDFVYQGFNSDIAGRVVFDGVLANTSGARLTYTNYEFGQTGRFSRQHEDHFANGDQFPFSYYTILDPISGRTDGLLAVCSKSKTCPRIMQADSDTEFWQARASLLVTDTRGHALALPGNVRLYMFSGFAHVTGTPSNASVTAAVNPFSFGECEQIQNPLTFSPYERALLVALGRWVLEGVEPPPSRYPNLKDHTLVTLERANALYPKIPNAPFSKLINRLRLVDYDKWPPATSGDQYPLFVPLTNADGNPMGGIEPPELTVPTGTYSGRNIRAEGFSQGELCNMLGSYIPFAATRKERLASGDSRLSLEERYHSQEDYAEKRKKAVAALVQQRFILPEDAAALSSGRLPSPAPPPQH